MDSVRRRRRGRFFRSAWAAAVSILGLGTFFGRVLMFLVINSPEKIAGAARRTEPPTGSLEGMIGAEVFSQHQTGLQVRLLLGLSTDKATSFFGMRTHWPKF